MKFVDRSRVPMPQVLASAEAEAKRAEMEAFLRDSGALKTQQRAPFDRSFLENLDVISTLATLFDNRCAYCESALPEPSPRHLHLHRPPGFAAGTDGETDMIHYVWLAYEWDNMLYVCDDCARAKSNFFPVKGKRADPRTPLEPSKASEEPLILDPCQDAPYTGLRFKPDGWIEAKNAQGDGTIRTLNLNREPLIEARREANRAIAKRLRQMNPPRIESIVGNAIPGMAFASTPDDPVPHPGATSQGLLNFAESVDIPSPDLATFVNVLVNSASSVRDSVLDAFLAATDGETASFAAPTNLAKSAAPTATRIPSRAVNISDLPLATAPITSARITNFKALKDISFTLPDHIEASELVPCMLILGENATGKSSVLEAITLALLGSDGCAALDNLIDDEEIRPSDMLHRPDPEQWDVVADDPLGVEITYVSQLARSRLNGSAGAARFGGDTGPAKILLAYGPRRYFSRKPARRFRAPEYRVRSLFDPIATIPNPAEWLLSVDQPTFDAAARALREVLMLDRSAYFAREGGRVIIETDSGRVPLGELSVGYKSVIAMATDIIREMMYHYDNIEYASAVVLVDEIETHLHPRWKMQIMTLLRRAFPRIQFIVTTHDPLCLKGMYDGEVFVLQRSPVDARVETLSDLPNPRGMRAEQVLTSEFFGLGTTDPETDAKLARLHALTRDQANLGTMEAGELMRLRQELGDRMVVGDSARDQVISEALKRAALDPVAPITRMKSAERKKMVSDLFTAIRDRRGPGG